MRPPGSSAACIARKKGGVSRWSAESDASAIAAASAACDAPVGGSGKLMKMWRHEARLTWLRRIAAASPPITQRFGWFPSSIREKIE